MRLTILGSAGSFPGPTSSCSCYLVEADGYAVLLDLGSGSFGVLQRHLDPAAVDAVLISHAHDDHWADLSGCAVYRDYHPGGALPPLPVWGPPGFAEQLTATLGADLPYDVSTWSAGAHQVGPFTVRVAVMDHPVATYAMRLEHDGASLTYSADTGPCDALVDLARGTDLLLCEASYTSDPPHLPGVHLTGAQAGEHATRAGAGRLVLTHLVAWNDDEQIRHEAAATYAGELALARPGDVYDL